MLVTKKFKGSIDLNLKLKLKENATPKKKILPSFTLIIFSSKL